MKMTVALCLLFMIMPWYAVSGEVNPQDTEPGSSDRLDILGTEKSIYSQDNEEIIIRDFFQDRRGGFFVDVGAAHYKELSTTFYLEKHLGWSGIAVDALEEYGPGYAEHRPGTEFVAAAVTDSSGGTIRFFRSDAWRELSSLDRSVTEEHGKKWRNDGSTTEVVVPTVTLDQLLEDRGVEKIDFLSMDIELSEPAALRGFDIRRFRPDLVCIEAIEEIQPQLADYFAANGYVRIDRYAEWDTLNWYFMPGE